MSDGDLQRYALGGALLQLRIGEALEVLERSGGRADLGFSTFSAYALERCSRGARWARETRAVGRRISAVLREALVSGRISWSMAELLVRHATEENEEALLQAASGRTVKEMRAFLGGKERKTLGRLRIECGVEELTLFEATRMLVRAIDGKRPTDDELMVSLLAEGESTLGIGRMPISPIEFDLEPETQVDRAAVVDETLPTSANELDAEIVRLCAEFERRNLEIGRLAKEVLESREWVRLGFRSVAAYAEARLGMSESGLRHRMTLARRCEVLPEIGAALDAGTIGYEAALLLTRIATPDNAGLWVARAAERTFKHLREEVDAVGFLVRIDPTASFDPPSKETMEMYFEFERKALRGGGDAGAKDSPADIRHRGAREDDPGAGLGGDHRRLRADRGQLLRGVSAQGLVFRVFYSLRFGRPGCPSSGSRPTTSGSRSTRATGGAARIPPARDRTSPRITFSRVGKGGVTTRRTWGRFATSATFPGCMRGASKRSRPRRRFGGASGGSRSSTSTGASGYRRRRPSSAGAGPIAPVGGFARPAAFSRGGGATWRGLAASTPPRSVGRSSGSRSRLRRRWLRLRRLCRCRRR